VTIEAYPELKSEILGSKLMRSLSVLENEIALMREGHNQSVERYNTRIRHIPELFIAKVFRFEEKGFFEANVEVQEVPGV
jgi:LemA protein